MPGSEDREWDEIAETLEDPSLAGDLDTVTCELIRHLAVIKNHAQAIQVLLIQENSSLNLSDVLRHINLVIEAVNDLAKLKEVIIRKQ